MKKSKFTEAQIAFALHQAQTGTLVEEVCRKLGISQCIDPVFSCSGGMRQKTWTG